MQQFINSLAGEPGLVYSEVHYDCQPLPPLMVTQTLRQVSKADDYPPNRDLAKLSREIHGTLQRAGLSPLIVGYISHF